MQPPLLLRCINESNGLRIRERGGWEGQREREREDEEKKRMAGEEKKNGGERKNMNRGKDDQKMTK